MKNKSEIFILTGAIQSGKTTALEKWSKGKSVGGILTPLVEGRRVVYDLAGACCFSFEANSNDKNVISVGRYYFLQEAFDKMNTLLKHQGNSQHEWLLIDEVGPLELRNEGLHSGLLHLLENGSSRLLMVVRNTLVKEVLRKYNLPEAKIITTETLPTLCID